MAETLDVVDRYLAAHPDTQYRLHSREWHNHALAALSESVRIFVWMSTAIAEVYFAGKITVFCARSLWSTPVIYKDARLGDGLRCVYDASFLIAPEVMILYCCFLCCVEIVSSALLV